MSKLMRGVGRVQGCQGQTGVKHLVKKILQNCPVIPKEGNPDDCGVKELVD